MNNIKQAESIFRSENKSLDAKVHTHDTTSLTSSCEYHLSVSGKQ